MTHPSTPGRRVAPRGVSLLEGMVATVVLLIGLTGVLQAVGFASLQNSMANRHLKATNIAQETVNAIQLQGRARLFASGGLLTSTWCSASPSATLKQYSAGVETVPSNLSGFSSCLVDLDSAAAGNATIKAMTTAYASTAAANEDDDTYTRVVAAYTAAASTEIAYVVVVVSWKEGGLMKSVKRFTALYDTNVNQTNVEF